MNTADEHQLHFPIMNKMHLELETRLFSVQGMGVSRAVNYHIHELSQKNEWPQMTKGLNQHRATGQSRLSHLSISTRTASAKQCWTKLWKNIPYEAGWWSSSPCDISHRVGGQRAKNFLTQARWSPMELVAKMAQRASSLVGNHVHGWATGEHKIERV